MDDVLVALHAAVHDDEARAHHDFPHPLKHFRPDHRIGHARLVLDGHEHHAGCRARALTHEDDAADTDTRTITRRFERGAREDVCGFEAGAQEVHRVCFEGETKRAVVVHHMLRPVSYTHLRAHETVLDLV